MTLKKFFLFTFTSAQLLFAQASDRLPESPGGDSKNNSMEKQSPKYKEQKAKAVTKNHTKTPAQQAEMAAAKQRKDEGRKFVQDTTKADLKKLKSQIKPKK